MLITPDFQTIVLKTGMALFTIKFVLAWAYM